jgi:hypothetical protein
MSTRPKLSHFGRLSGRVFLPPRALFRFGIEQREPHRARKLASLREIQALEAKTRQDALESLSAHGFLRIM